MLNRTDILANVPVDNRTIVVKTNYNTQDIINTVLAADRHAAHYTEKIASSFKGNSVLETASKIWQFLKEEITYKEDPEGIQDIKAPSQLLHTGFGDCKSFSVFTASILRNLSIPYRYRFASYKADGVPTHVYVIAKNENNQDVIIDAVWHSFNQEKKFTSKKDYIMQLRYISGIGANGPELTNSDFTGIKGTLTQLLFKDNVENNLRKGAQFFIYLFIHKQALPNDKQFKWEKAIEVKNEIIKYTGLKEESFFRFIREEIKLQTGKKPEELLPISAVAFSNYTEELRDNIQKDINWRSDAKALNNDFQQNREKWYKQYGWLPLEEWFKYFYTKGGFPPKDSAASKQLYENYYKKLQNLKALNAARVVNSDMSSVAYEKAYQSQYRSLVITYEGWYNWMKAVSEENSKSKVSGIGKTGRPAIGIAVALVIAILGVIVAILQYLASRSTVKESDVPTSDDYLGLGYDPSGKNTPGNGGNGSSIFNGGALANLISSENILPLGVLLAGGYMAFTD